MLGFRLRSLRENKGLTQAELANQLDISRGTYAHYELDKREPDNETISKFAQYFAVTTDYLLGVSDDPRPVNPSTNKSASAKETRQLEKLLEMDGLTFKGAPLSEDDKNKIKAALEIAFWDAKEKNKRS
ncbi:helix-turn-helix transcriptional regulator [uncultured Anaeromusa sp.]|uniref:helix-turn-helix domain-containing protein n=1 Tax=uncultured Anaeromusa sp. TaxID=673273 RepID=UPI0029C74BD9|nr:helix-turn-helix transcriptional regulator [uncultured Anaeromusa sp.]